MFISVITCTHNPDVETLVRVFRALDQQSLPKDRWEYVVIDNGSAQPLRDSLDLKWHPRGRVIPEPEQGLTKARLRGIAETQTDAVVFVDDDNILDPDYLETVCALLEKYPFIGMLGGVGRGEFQGVIQPWMKDFLYVLCITEPMPDSAGSDIQYALTRKIGSWMPIGAGMVVRRNLAERYRQVVLSDPWRLGLDRTSAHSLVGGGDTDLTFTCMDQGMACGVSPRLKFTHVIPAWRLNADYFEQLLYSSNYGLAQLLIAHRWKNPTQPDHVPPWVHLKWLWTCLMARSPSDRCWRAQHRGYLDGLAQRPYDERYR